MPSEKYVGSGSGTGNPPGKYSKGYLKSSESGGHFISNKGYRGGMNVGVNSSSTEVGNQVKSTSSSELSSMRTQAIP